MQLRNVFTLVLTVLMGSLMTLSAQEQPQMAQPATTDFSDETLESFVNANMDIQKVQMQGKEDMKQVIENQENLDIPTYRKIITSKRSAEGEGPDVSDEQMAAFESAQKEIQNVQMEIQKDMREVIESHELTVQEYQGVQQAYQSDKELQQKVMKMQKAKMEEKAKEAASEKEMN